MTADPDDVVRLAADLVRFDTTNFGGGESRGERPAAEYAVAALAEVGIDARLLESAPGRANVVARVPGADPALPALLVHGHLDVVPAVAADWQVDPFAGEIRDGMLWGRGTIDMKGACAITLATVRALARAGARPRRDVVLAFLADEEDSGCVRRRLAGREAPRPLHRRQRRGERERRLRGAGRRVDRVSGGRRGARLSLDAPHRPRHGRARVEGQFRQRRTPSGGGAGTDRRAPLAAAGARAGARLPTHGRRRARRRRRPRRSRGFDRATRRTGCDRGADVALQHGADHAAGRLQGLRRPRRGDGVRRRQGAARLRGRLRGDGRPAARPACRPRVRRSRGPPCSRRGAPG